MSETVTADQIPWHSPGLIHLGPNNGSAITRLAYYAVALLKTKLPIPEGPFAEWAAGRICGDDVLDLVIFLAGRRGSGKSFSSLWMAIRIAKKVAKIKGGKWQDYFKMDNIATLENTEKVMEILNSAGMHNVVIIDDASLAINNRNWASVPSKNFVALLTICRDRRWCLILTAPLKKMADNQVRDMVDLTATVYKPYHADVNGRGGFNILKLVSGDISTSGKEYTKKMHFEKKKIDFWVTFRPEKDIIDEYNKRRSEGRQKVINSIVEHGTYQMSSPREKKPRINAAEQNTLEYIKKHGEELQAAVMKDPSISMNRLSIELAVSPLTAARAIKIMGLSTEKKIPKMRIEKKKSGIAEVFPDGS
jgi:hypothetical protein